MTFLNDLRAKLKEGNRADTAELLKMKQELEPGATEVNQWDSYYLSNKLQEKRYKLDLDKVREYFPTDVVVPGMLQVYADMLGLKFKEVQNPKSGRLT